MKYLSLTPVYFLFFTFLHHIVLDAYDLSHICSDSYPGDGLSDKTLAVLFTNLSSEASPTGFSIKSISQDQDVVNGLALCRGDIDGNDCKACITQASSRIVQRCPENKGGIIWYTACLLKYSKDNFFGTIDYQKQYYNSLKYISDNVNVFNKKTKEFLSQLTTEVETKPMLFATGEVELWNTVKLYGFVQCTRDLSGAQCKTCLEEAVRNFDNCCANKEGGRIHGGSCIFRYEIYPFLTENDLILHDSLT